jgi:hypothetical protein
MKSTSTEERLDAAIALAEEVCEVCDEAMLCWYQR